MKYGMIKKQPEHGRPGGITWQKTIPEAIKFMEDKFKIKIIYKK